MLDTALSIALALITLAWVLNLYRLIIGHQQHCVDRGVRHPGGQQTLF